MSTCRTGLFGVKMLYTFLDEHDYEEDEPNTRELEVTDGRIEFRDVNFAYRPGETVLHAVNFVAEAGRTTALVGRSGGGKSTMMNLILRLYEVGSGQILCDGVDIATVGLTSLRRQIAYVAQDNFLFKGSVRDNIAMGRPERERGRDRRRRQGGLRPRFHHELREGLQFALRRAAARSFPAASASASPSPAPSSRTRRSSCSTKRPRRSIRSPSRRSRRRCARSARAAPRSSSPTGCRQWRRPTKSASSIAAGSSSAAGMSSSWRRGARTATSPRRSSHATRRKTTARVEPRSTVFLGGNDRACRMRSRRIGSIGPTGEDRP